MTKTRWTDKDTCILIDCYLRRTPIDVILNMLNHIKPTSIRMKISNCLYLDRGKVKGSLEHASKMHIKHWNRMVKQQYNNQLLFI